MALVTREDKIRHNGRENVDSVPLGGTEMVDSMAPSPSPADKPLTKKRPTQTTGCGIAEAATVS